MHDSTASSYVGSDGLEEEEEDGSPAESCSSSSASDACSDVFDSCRIKPPHHGSNSALFFADHAGFNEMLAGGSPFDCGSKDYIVDLMFLKSGGGGSGDVGAKMNEARMAARRAEEAGRRVDAIRNAKQTMSSDSLQDSSFRRQQAAQWLQSMVGSLSLPGNPTVEDLRVFLKDGYVLCKVIDKVQPGSVPKVEDPSNPTQRNEALPNYLYYDNVRNFLVAVKDMGLPAFEASTLEQGPMSSSSSAKLVDCILALKSYHDWKQGGALGFWRLKSPTGSGSCVTSSRHSNHPKNMSNSRRKWMLSDQEPSSLSCSPDQSASFHDLHKDNRASFDDITRLDQDGVDGKGDEPLSSPETSASTSAWLQDIRHKFSEVLQVKAKRAQDALSADPIMTDGYGGGATMTYDHCATSQSLLSLISAIIGDKSAEEVPVLVEFMLRKIMEEFERHLFNQRTQVTKMKNTLKDMIVREEKLASVEALPAGTQEETKIGGEEVENEKRRDNTKQQHPDDKRGQHFDYAKKEIEVENMERVTSLQIQLTDSYKKMQEVESRSSRLKVNVAEKEDKLRKNLSRVLKGIKDLRWASLDAKEVILRVQFDWNDQIMHFGEGLQTLVAAAAGYHKVLAENRQLYSEVQDLKGNIRVYCRVRPFLTKDSTKHTTIDYIGQNGDIVLAIPGKPVGKESRRSFTFNRCFDTKSLQEEVFLDTQPLIRSVLDGFNVCIFAYGQTGSGKTYTMSGPTNMTPANWGVNYRALNDLFQLTQTRVDVFKYEIGVQMLEIYNEQVRDLLVTDGSHKKLEIRNNSQLNGLNVPDANIMPVTSTDDVLELMKLGQKNRAVGSTSLNERSSRSHSVVTVHVQGKDLDTGNIFRGSLHLVDLAGSERVDKSEVTGDRLKEAQHINKSLSALGDVISALAQKNGHVPYRNSKLTQLLQDSLGGQAKTLMFVHISPDADSFGETMSTLKFAERVASVELGAARSNKESGEIQVLKDQVYQLKEVVSKRDAEIVVLNQTMKEQLEKANNSAEKVKAGKPTNASKPRRRTSNEAQAQKVRKATTENGNPNAETLQSLRKGPGEKKTPTISLSTGLLHDPAAEDSTAEHSSAACSPLDSPTENKLPVPAFEDYNAGGRGVLKQQPQPQRLIRPPQQEPVMMNGSFETVLLDTMLNAQKIVAKGGGAGAFLLNSDVGLDPDCEFGDEMSDQAFEARGMTYGQDDTASLYSDSGLSAEADNSGSSVVMDQTKKVTSNSSRYQKGSSEVGPVTPVTSNSRSSLRKAAGGVQVRLRRQSKPVEVSKAPPKLRHQVPLSSANANQEVDSASSRRSSSGVASLTTWR